jgi:GWxTD domain-containing protein
MRLRLAIGIFMFGLLVSPTVLYGQAEQNEEVQLAFADGVKASKAEEPKRAVDLLERVFVNSPSYVDPDYGPVAFWLGRALAEDGYPDKARTVLRTGILLMQEEEAFYPRLADAFMHRVFADRDTAEYDLAVDIYREMLRRVATMSDSLGPDARQILTEHLRHFRLILPEDIQRRAGLPIKDEARIQFSSVDGSVLGTWWRQEDPLPATAVNERLRAHLRRVAYAREEYPHPDETEPPLLDARGDIYVRLGAPDETVEVNYDESRLTDLIDSPGGVQVNRSDFPENEFWSYGSLDRRTYYIFVRKGVGEPYSIGTVGDLLPSQLRKGFVRGAKPPNGATMRDQQSRGRDRAVKALATLRTIYRQYAPFHPDMATRHDNVANYMMNAGMEQGDVRGSKYAPEDFVRRTVSSMYNRDQVAADMREENTPTQAASFLDESIRPLDIVTRTARFLNEDGTTRTEVYWAPEAGALVPESERKEMLEEKEFRDPEDYFLQFTAVQKTPDYRNRAVDRDQYRVTGIDETGRVTIPAQTYATQQGDSSLYHLGLQWDQYLLESEEGDIGPKIKVAAAQEDSLRPLEQDESVLEMSDLRPVVFPEDSYTPEGAVPYPFRDVPPDAALGFYFEIYHLSFNADDRTEYTVEYEVEGREERGVIAGALLGEDGQRTAAETSFEGRSRAAEEYILLDLSNWEGEEDTDLSVTVRVEDKTSGKEVERSMEFELVAPPGE